jgi:hypothetical protein
VESNANGFWRAGASCEGDVGPTHSWNGAAAPEPSTWAMMLLGFAGLGFAGYRSSLRLAASAA